MGVGFVIMFFYLLHSLVRGEKAASNPWGSRALEWQTTSPAAPHNFEHTPVVIHGPYDYHKPMSEFQLGIAHGHHGESHQPETLETVAETGTRP